MVFSYNIEIDEACTQALEKMVAVTSLFLKKDVDPHHLYAEEVPPAAADTC